MTGPDILRTWGEIEAHLRLSRKTIQSHGYPVMAGPRGGIWAERAALDRHMWERSRLVVADIPARSQPCA